MQRERESEMKGEIDVDKSNERKGKRKNESKR